MADPETDHRPEATPRIIDLDQASAARSAIAKAPIVVRFKGQEFTFPPQAPALAVHWLAREDYIQSFALALGDDQAREFWALEPTIDDLIDLVENLAGAWGIRGNSRASGASSKSTSRR